MALPAPNAPRHAPIAPPATELHRLYITEGLSVTALTERYHVGKASLQGWLSDAGIAIRTQGQAAGRHCELNPPPETVLRRLYIEQRLPAADIAALLDVSSATILNWLAAAGIERLRSALKGRPRRPIRPAASRSGRR